MAAQGRTAAVVLGLIVLAMFTWHTLRIGGRITAKTRFKFLSRSLTVITLIVGAVAILTVQHFAMRPAFHLEWALGMYAHPPIPLYAGAVVFITVVGYLLLDRRAPNKPVPPDAGTRYHYS